MAGVLPAARTGPLSLCEGSRFIPGAVNMDQPRQAEIIGGKRPVKGIIAVSGYADIAQRGVAPHPYNQQGVGKELSVKAELDDVAGLGTAQGKLTPEGSWALVGGQKVIQVFRSRPGGRSVVKGEIIPPKDWRQLCVPVSLCRLRRDEFDASLWVVLFLP